MRKHESKRKTAETDITLCLDLDGTGSSQISTGSGFLDHMLTLFAHHSGFDLSLTCVGDLHVDCHHTTEDIAIVLGKSLDAILADRKGIKRYGSAIITMDESLVLAAIDIGGRSSLTFNAAFPTQKIGDFDTELVREFFAAFARSMNVSIHIHLFCGDNSHHIAEAVFKAFARALSFAAGRDSALGDRIPSSKGWVEQ